MALYSPPNRSCPQELPNYWKFEDGTVRTDLQTLTDAELEALGWHGPIEMPPSLYGYGALEPISYIKYPIESGRFAGTSMFTHDYIWNSNTLSFDAVELSDTEKEKRIDYRMFWIFLTDGVGIDIEGLTNSSEGIAYKKIKESAKTSLEVNTAVTEFICLISDAKNGIISTHKIRNSIIEILQLVQLTDEEMNEIKFIFAITGMYLIYNLE